MKFPTGINKETDRKLCEFFTLDACLNDASSGQKVSDELVIVRIYIFIDDLQPMLQLIR